MRKTLYSGAISPVMANNHLSGHSYMLVFQIQTTAHEENIKMIGAKVVQRQPKRKNCKKLHFLVLLFTNVFSLFINRKHQVSVQYLRITSRNQSKKRQRQQFLLRQTPQWITTHSIFFSTLFTDFCYRYFSLCIEYDKLNISNSCTVMVIEYLKNPPENAVGQGNLGTQRE